LLTGDEFWATAQYGSFMNGERIAAQSDDVFYLIAYEAQIPNKDIASVLGLLSAARRTRCLGAIALDLAYLAYGSVSVFTSPSPSRSFDFGAGYLLVKEAGGVMSNMEGNSIEQVALDLSKSTTILASGNRRLHDKALTLLRGELIT
jgi:myo-inositol-1(or 4)-monophosphatase